MRRLNVQIIQCLDDSFPGWVEFTLTDASGKAHHFIEKISVICSEHLDSHTVYPVARTIECQVISQLTDHEGKLVVEVDTSTPWGITSTTGESIFIVLESSMP